MRLYTRGEWWKRRPVLVLVLLLSVFVLRGPYSGSSRTEIAQAWIDPWARIPAQDEALYAHSAMRMANGEEWLTPHFLGRKLLVKPPWVMWLSATSQKWAGDLRWPHVLASAALATIVFSQVGPVGWLLLLSRGYWRERAGLVMMDDWLILFYVLAGILLVRDPKLEGRWSGWGMGALCGMAVMTKWFAGFLPLALLLWSRPRWEKWGQVGVGLALVAMPWHVYQWVTNREWFLAEYIGVELLTYAVAAPVQATQETVWWFYGSRMWWLTPMWAVAAWAVWRKRVQTVWLVWSGVLVLALVAYGYRNASYLLPLAPILLLVHRGCLHWAWLGLVFVAWVGPAVEPAVVPRELLRGREVLHLDPSDQLRTSLASGATVRYVFFLEHLPPNGPLDFEKLGIAKGWREFLAGADAKTDVVLTPNLEALAGLVRESPQRDFILPRQVWLQLGGAVSGAHEVAKWIEGDRVWLKSRRPQAGPRPNPF